MSGVTTLNSLSGAVNIQGGTPNVSVATAGQNVSVSVASTGVTRLSTNPATANASGNVVLKAGTGMGIVADSFNNITFTATGGGGGECGTSPLESPECLRGWCGGQCWFIGQPQPRHIRLYCSGYRKDTSSC